MTKPPVRPPSATPPRVLVVDDDAATVDALREVFAEGPMEIEVASSAEQAIERFRDRTYSVVLADLQQPGESGVELVRRLAREAPATAVVVMTGHASVQTAVTALKLGAVDYLVKPMSAERLLRLVEQVASASRSSSPSRAAPPLQGGSAAARPLVRRHGEGEAMGESFVPGEVIKHYGVYRCSCGGDELFGVSGRRFPRAHCDKGAWTLVHRARRERFF